MKKKARLLLKQGIDSLLLAIEFFNRPWNRGRLEAVLIHLNHSFEMLLKAIILHKGGRIYEPRSKETIGFERCTNKCLSEEKLKCLTEEQAITLRAINGLRDAAMHDLVDLSEQQLYLYTQAGVTLFADLLSYVFARSLADYLPGRALPVSTEPPSDLLTVMDEEFKHIQSLLSPGKRRRVEATARLRSMAIFENAVMGKGEQPNLGQLDRLANRVRQGESWTSLFPGIASLRLDREGMGPSFSIRISKTNGLPIKLVKEGEEAAEVVAVRRVNELGFYNLGRNDLAAKVGLTRPKTSAIIRYLKLQESEDYFKEIVIGKSHHQRYSRKALDVIRKSLTELDMKMVWAEYRSRQQR